MQKLVNLADFCKVLYEVDFRATLPVLQEKRFWKFPASTRWHHWYTGGLAAHTFEVMLGTKALLEAVGAKNEVETGLIAALWHDFGKLEDYEEKDGIWQYTPHHSRTRHVVKSWHLFLNSENSLPAEQKEAVGHAILAHHGRKEWGSPVEPQDKVAWALHLADMMSANAGEGIL